MNNFSAIHALAAAFCILLLIPVKAGEANENIYEVKVVIKDLRNSKGVVRIALYESEDGFPDDYSKALKTLTVKIEKKKARGTFKNVSPGRYAVGVLHDENENKEMDTNWFGIPTEGYGASKDARGTFGPPDFDDASFDVTDKDVSLDIKVAY